MSLSLIYWATNQKLTIPSMVFVHGLGGHPLETWQHVHATSIPAVASTSAVAEKSGVKNASHSKLVPMRARSLMRDWTSPGIKKGRTLTKTSRPPNAIPQSKPVPSSKDRGAVSRSRSAEPAPADQLQLRPKVRFNESDNPEHGQRQPIPSRPQESSHLTLPKQRRSKTRAVYWPLDLLPDSFPDSRIFTFGCQTVMADQRLVIGQMDIFERGRQLLEGMEELRRVDGLRRQIVFVAHSTGAIIVKEVSYVPRMVGGLCDSNGGAGCDWI